MKAVSQEESPLVSFVGHLTCWLVVGIALWGSFFYPQKEQHRSVPISEKSNPIEYQGILGTGLATTKVTPDSDLSVTSEPFAHEANLAVEGLPPDPTEDQQAIFIDTEPPTALLEVSFLAEGENLPPTDSPTNADMDGEEAFHPIIVKTADQYQVDAALVKAIIMAESRYNPKAVSKKGAKGLMQLMPATAKALGVQDLFNPKHNIDAGVRYFRHLLDQFDGDVELALAAYNAGSRKVRKFNGIPPIAATRFYIKKVMKYYRRYSKEAS
jgi:hypothetical protein